MIDRPVVAVVAVEVAAAAAAAAACCCCCCLLLLIACETRFGEKAKKIATPLSVHDLKIMSSCSLPPKKKFFRSFNLWTC